MAGAAAGGFVTRSFETMLKECSSTKKYPDLQKAIQSCIDNANESSQDPAQSEAKQSAPLAGDGSSGEPEGGVEKEGTGPGIVGATTVKTGAITATLASAGNTLDGAQAELVLNPLRLAFETKNMKILEPALDCLHKLIAYDHLEGDPGLEGGKNVPLLTDILTMVCNSIDNSSPDSTILLVLKLLLTAVASAKFRVHGESLLGVIRVCYNIALNSKNPINQATSKEMLTQIISIVFRRMETDLVTAPSGSAGNPEAGLQENLEAGVETSSSDQNDKTTTLGDALSQAKESSLASVEELQSLAGGADIKGLEALLDKAVNTEDGKKITRGIDLESMSIGQRDALLVFRTLCKMGMKEDTDEVAAKTRILSLELLQVFCRLPSSPRPTVPKATSKSEKYLLRIERFEAITKKIEQIRAEEEALIGPFDPELPDSDEEEGMMASFDPEIDEDEPSPPSVNIVEEEKMANNLRRRSLKEELAAIGFRHPPTKPKQRKTGRRRSAAVAAGITLLLLILMLIRYTG